MKIQNSVEKTIEAAFNQVSSKCSILIFRIPCQWDSIRGKPTISRISELNFTCGFSDRNLVEKYD